LPWLPDQQQGRHLSWQSPFWPPSKNQDAHRIIPVQFENPRLNELRSQLEDAEQSLDEIRRMNTEAFKSGKSFEQIKKIQKEMDPMAQKVSDIQMELTRESPYAIEERIIQYQRGSWPITASDDWCGQWKSNG
jgi:hypothetical protein